MNLSNVQSGINAYVFPGEQKASNHITVEMRFSVHMS